MLQILMRKIKLQKGLTMGARSKIESSQEAILSLKKHILDFQDFFFSLPKIKIECGNFVCLAKPVHTSCIGF